MSAGQLTNVVVCAQASNAPIGQVLGPIGSQLCPSGQDLFVVQAYLPLSSSSNFFDGLFSPFDPSVAGGIFGFAFGLVVFFYLIGLKGSVILRPFWGGRY